MCVPEDVEKLDLLYTTGGNVKWHGCFGKVWQLLQRSNTMLPYDPVIPFFVYENWKSISTQKQFQNVYSSIIHSKQKLGTTQWDSTRTWPWNRKTSGGQEGKLRPGGQKDKLTARMSPPLHALVKNKLKNAEFYLPSNGLLFLPWHGKFHKPAIFKKPVFSYKPTLSPSYKGIQRGPAPKTSSEDHPFLRSASLVLEHSLNKICLEISAGFSLAFYLGEPKNPNTSNKIHQSMNGLKCGMRLAAVLSG